MARTEGTCSRSDDRERRRGFGIGYAVDLPVIARLVGTLVGAALAAFLVAPFIRWNRRSPH